MVDFGYCEPCKKMFRELDKYSEAEAEAKVKTEIDEAIRRAKAFEEEVEKASE